MSQQDQIKIAELEKFFSEITVVLCSYMTGSEKILLVTPQELIRLKTLASQANIKIKFGYND
jgi:hypothetical protein